MSALEMTKDLLVDAGGWPELKKARSLHENGAVAEASYENGVLSGQVRIGGKLKKVRMVIRSRTDIENFCTCLMVRRDGRVCAHAMALGLEILSPRKIEPAEEPVPAVDSWPKTSAEADEISLSVMLPLKIAPAWERGQLMLGFGLKKNGEEALLSHLETDEKVSLQESDEELWRVLREIFPQQAPGVATLSPAEFLELLGGLIAHPQVFFGKKNRAKIHAKAQKLAQLKLTGERLRVSWPSEGQLLAKDGKAWQVLGNEFFPLVLGLPKRWWPLLEGGQVVAAEDLRHAFSALSQWFEIEPELWQKLPSIREPEILIELEGSLRHLEAKAICKYGKHRLVAGAARLLEDEAGVSFLSDELAEAQVLDFLAEWGFSQGKRGSWQITEREDILQFHAYGLAELKNRWAVSLGERFRAAAAQIVPVQARFDMKGSGEDWFAVSLDYEVDGESLPRAEIQRLLRMGQVEKPFGRGKIAVFNPTRLNEVAEVLSDCEPQQDQPGIFQVNRRLAAYLRHASQELGVQTDEWPQEEITELDDRLGALEKTLRPYQKEGVEWLWRLSELGMGGILADDMGLGKTLQTLAFLKARGGKALVVCPSSLVDNWVAEAQKFVPELSVAGIHGSQRASLRKKHAATDLWITSYALLRIDASELAARDFDIVVLDEAQRIKNPDSQVAKAAFSLKTTHRVALTGTPLENSLLDLWSIMNFVLPGYLGGRKVFSERFEKPIRAGDSALARRLALKMKPVMKRRLKREVAQDLPERIELVRYVEPSKKQREIYHQILQESRSQVQEAEGGKKRMVALTALLRLRQACCDLRLLPGIKVADDEAGAKLAALEELLEEAVASGHRVLVFSQFVQLLQAVVPILAARSWGFCYLDGQTKKRGEVVSRFQENDDIPVFLISLKAGGVGLNLTAADTVVHLDPWWNPAVEAQATDRAHRIGQERVVTSYKLITKGTVEEKILALQERKKELIADTLDENFTHTTALAEDELTELLQD